MRGLIEQVTHVVKLDKGADHTGAQSALLAGWDMEGHVGGLLLIVLRN